MKRGILKLNELTFLIKEIPHDDNKFMVFIYKNFTLTLARELKSTEDPLDTPLGAQSLSCLWDFCI